jgi:hypothetical protein
MSEVQRREIEVGALSNDGPPLRCETCAGDGQYASECTGASGKEPEIAPAATERRTACMAEGRWRDLSAGGGHAL